MENRMKDIIARLDAVIADLGVADTNMYELTSDIRFDSRDTLNTSEVTQIGNAEMQLRTIATRLQRIRNRVAKRLGEDE